MKDTIIKGSGNSREIKSVPNFASLYPTWESFRDAFGTKGIPIDLLGLVAAGVDQIGTDLNKANLLTDATEQAIWGDVSDRTPNQAFLRLNALISTTRDIANSKAGIKGFAYTGTGTSPKTFSFEWDPAIVFVTNNEIPNTYGQLEEPTFMIAIQGQSGVITGYNYNTYRMVGAHASWSALGLSLSKPSGTSNYSFICNKASTRYRCVYL